MQQPDSPLIKALLYPLSLLYGIVVGIRNLLFDWGILPSREFPFPVISVGNITVGGTGKTPHVEHIVSILKDDFRIAVLSRGYKRKTSGFRIVSTGSGPDDVGDEPLQVKKKFPEAEVAVDGNRVRGIKELCRYNMDLSAFILDDAFQHRWVKPGISVLLVDYNRPLNTDMLLPAGGLREYISAKNRAAIVIVTKCPPDVKPIGLRLMTKELDLYPWQSLYFTGFSYGEPLPVFAGSQLFPEREEIKSDNIHALMVTGIATPEPLKEYLDTIFPDVRQLIFPDHHRFREKDLRRISREWQSVGEGKKLIITTEKDAMRFRNIDVFMPEIRENMFYIPVRVKFIDKEEDKFNKQIIDYVRKNKRDHIIC